MKFKQFIKPDWRKIGIVVIMSLFFPFISYSIACSLKGRCYVEFTSLIGMNYRTLPFINLSIPIGDLGFNSIFINIFSSLSLIVLFVLYLVSCLIVWIHDKVKKR